MCQNQLWMEKRRKYIRQSWYYVEDSRENEVALIIHWICESAKRSMTIIPHVQNHKSIASSGTEISDYLNFMDHLNREYIREFHLGRPVVCKIMPSNSNRKLIAAKK